MMADIAIGIVLVFALALIADQWNGRRREKDDDKRTGYGKGRYKEDRYGEER